MLNKCLLPISIPITMDFIILKQSFNFSLIKDLKKNHSNNCFAVNTLIHTTHEKEAVALKFFPEKLLWKVQVSFEKFLKVQVEYVRLQIRNFIQKVLYHHCFPHNFVKVFRTNLRLLVCQCQKRITALTFQINTRQENVRGTNKFLDNSSFIIVKSEHDIACGVQPIKYWAEDCLMPFFCSRQRNLVVWSLGCKSSLVLKRSAALKTLWKTCTIKYIFSKATISRAKAYHFPIKELFTILAPLYLLFVIMRVQNINSTQ